MKFLKIKLLVIAVIDVCGELCLCDVTDTVTVNTSSLIASTGYLYLQYDSNSASLPRRLSVSRRMLTGRNDAVTCPDAFSAARPLPASVMFPNTHFSNTTYLNHHLQATHSAILQLLAHLAPTHGSASTFCARTFSMRAEQITTHCST